MFFFFFAKISFLSFLFFPQFFTLHFSLVFFLVPFHFFFFLVFLFYFSFGSSFFVKLLFISISPILPPIFFLLFENATLQTAVDTEFMQTFFAEGEVCNYRTPTIISSPIIRQIWLCQHPYHSLSSTKHENDQHNSLAIRQPPTSPQ